MSCVPESLTAAVYAESVQVLRDQLPESVSSGLMARYLRLGMQAFCRDSLVWRFVFEPLAVLEGEAVYRVAEADGAAVVKVLRAFVVLDGGREVLLPERQDVQHTLDSYQWWYEPQPGTVILNHEPERGETLRLAVALMPTETDGQMPMELYRLYREVIEAWALARLRLMPEKAWTQFELGQMHQQMYVAGVEKARQKHLRDMPYGRPAYRDQFSFLRRM